MKKNKSRPWIKSNGKPMTDSELRRASRSWDRDTWEDYLRWYDGSLKECHLSPSLYDRICAERSETIYAEYGYQIDEPVRRHCSARLGSLPKLEAKVLTLYFYEGLTELEIALRLKRSQGGVHLIKNRALSQLRRKMSPSELIAIHIMRGLVSQDEIETPSPWDTQTYPPIHEYRAFLPENWRAELGLIRNEPFRRAVADLSEDQQRIIYLRFFCNQSFRRIARQLGIGINVAQDICDATVFKIKSRVAVEMNSRTMEDLSCA